MKFVQVRALHPVKVWLPLQAARLVVRKAALVMKGTSSVEINVFPTHSVAASTMTSTIASMKYFIPMDSVRRSANAHKTER